MPATTPSMRPARSRRARSVAFTTLAIGILVASCGGSSPHPATASHATGAGLRSATGGATTSSSTAPGAYGSGPLAFARCMRANGVPNFPDPAPGSGLVFNTAGVDRSSPASKAAQAKCQKLLPSGGPGPTFSEQSLVKVRKVAVCMRAHGIAEFPDPKIAATGRLPSPPPGISLITDYDGALLEFPATINMQSPAYKQAAAACGTLAQKLGSGAHS